MGITRATENYVTCTTRPTENYCIPQVSLEQLRTISHVSQVQLRTSVADTQKKKKLRMRIQIHEKIMMQMPIHALNELWQAK
jgi:hypothetical protein